MTLRILTVCTGNICRSPFASKLLESRLDRKQFEIASAGTSAMQGDRMPESMRDLAVTLGIQGAEKHRAQSLTPGAVAQADLILGMDRVHRSEAAKLQPRAARYSFTLLEFAHIVSHISDDQLQRLLLQHGDSPTAPIEAVTRIRGVVPRLTPERLYDLPDPYGRSRQVYARSAAQIEQAVDQIVSFFQRTAELTAALRDGHSAVVAIQDRK